MFIDVHCHLDSRFYDDKEVKEVVGRAVRAGVGIVVASGIGHSENEEVLDLIERFGIVRGVLGMHPSEKFGDWKSEIDFVRKNAKKIIGIGEIGLDFLETKNSESEQKKVFAEFVKLGLELDLGLIVHSRKAEKECVEILEELGAKRVVMHCFSGRKSLIDRIASNGWSFSVPASVKYNEHFQNLVNRVDIFQLLCETDSPFLHPSRNGQNEPAFVVESYRAIARIKGVSVGEVEKRVGENFEKLFGKG